MLSNELHHLPVYLRSTALPHREVSAFAGTDWVARTHGGRQCADGAASDAAEHAGVLLFFTSLVERVPTSVRPIGVAGAPVCGQALHTRPADPAILAVKPFRARQCADETDGQQHCRNVFHIAL